MKVPSMLICFFWSLAIPMMKKYCIIKRTRKGSDVVSYMDLNAKQYEAMTTVDKHVRIIAGAGSGKTRVVTARIAYLIEKCHVSPQHILAITFTNKAAREMKERVEKMLPHLDSSVKISTIHSFCMRMLREDIYVLGYPRNFTVLDSDDARSILKDAYKQMHIDVKAYSYASMLAYISGNKTGFVSPQTALEMAKYDEKEQIRAKVYEYYQKRLKEMYALDFDDLLLFAHRLLKDAENIRLKWQRKFRYIHVDEFQDVDALQYEIISLLCGENTYLCVVGDPDQTIYTWRGADVGIILRFDRDFKDAKTIILNENYRSTPTILNAANAVIAYNRNRIKKDLYTNNQDEGKIVYFNAVDELSQPTWVAAKIATLHRDQVPYSQIAILYRSNYLSRSLEHALHDQRIPYRIYGGLRFYERMEIKDALSYLRLLLPKHEDDQHEKWKDLAIKRIINVPKRGIGAKSLEKLETYAQEHDINMYEALLHDGIFSGKAKSEIKRFCDIIVHYQQKVEDLALDHLLESLLEDVGYITMLEEDKEIERIENIKELIEDIANYVEAHPEGTLEEYLQEISLYTDKDEIDGQECVQLMSVHAAKGLEFDHVFVYELCEGVFPNKRSMDESGKEGLEEERRLAYVAFTRARKKLYLSSSSGYSYVMDGAKLPSRFIREIPEEYLSDRRKQQTNVSSKTSQTTARMQNINTQPEAAPRRSSGKYNKGDKVVHSSFGEGVIIRIDKNIATIAFGAKFGIRKLMVNHPALSKKNK